MYDVLILSDDVATARLFDAVLAAGVSPKTASNWIMGDVMAYCNVSNQDFLHFVEELYSGLNRLPALTQSIINST